MILSDICIRRPVFATVMSLVILLLGLISFQRLSVREYPKIDEPVVSVSTTYKGASPEVIESRVTKPLEDSLAGIEGVDVMTSQSRSETSNITVRFKLTRDPDAAAADVRDKVARVRAVLPDNVDEPVIAKVEADANPILYLAFSSDRYSQLEVSDYVKRYVRPRLSTLPGASDVRIFGERQVSMRIWLDRAKLAAYRLTTQDVETALARQNVEIPAGRIESRQREFTVLAETDLQTPEQFANIVVKDTAGNLIRMKDVARVEIGPADDRVITRSNGKSAVALGVIKNATANPLELAKAVDKEIVQIGRALPEGMALEKSYDSTIFIDRSIHEVFITILEAAALVVLVIFVFLRSVRATLIPIVTIPVSLVGAFALMYAFNFTVNTLTLLAMVLAIGLVVDDAIVVLENIFRHMEHGVPRKQAALIGAKEIGFAVIAMTLTLAAVYAPLAFATGRTGRLFIEFALTLAGSVLVSGFVALTLSPMMCSQILRYQATHSPLYNAIERFFTGLTRSYRRALTAVLERRVYVALAWVIAFGAGVVLFAALKQELAPIEDRGTVVGVVSAPEGATIGYTAGYMRQVEALLAKVPEGQKYFTVAGYPTVADGISFLLLKPWEERRRKQQDVVKELFPQFFGLPGVLAFPISPASLGQGFGRPVAFVVMTQAPYEELQRVTGRLMAEAAKNSGLTNIDSDLKLNKPELKVDVNRDKLADVGIPVESVSRTLETMLGGRQVTRFKKDGEQYDVIVKVANVDRSNPDDITAIYTRSRNGDMVELSNFVKVRESVSPKSLNHFNKLRAATITANLAPGYTLGQALEFMQSAAAKALPPTAQTDLDGQSREFRDSSSSIYVTLVLALAFIYLVLSGQFESFVDPFVIMLTVPLAFTGALATLWLTGGTLSIYSKIGLITLVGLITKHGILIVEFANQLQDQGKSVHDAVIEAAVLRLRPILMTTGAMVLGAVPLALASGAGAESRVQIGWVIVGGMVLGTCLTLFVVPTAYTFLARRRHVAAPETESVPHVLGQPEGAE